MSPLVLPAVLLALLALAALVSWFIERREWFRDVQMYVDEPPREDERSSIVRHRRELDTRGAA